MGVSIQLKISENLFLRDPEDTELGRKIIDRSITMIDELGFEKFSFRKLAGDINSTETSMYRYFDNKHKLLVYLVSWYWLWVEYNINYQTHNIDDPHVKLSNALKVIANPVFDDPIYTHIDKIALHRIVVHESQKAYHTKEVDEENKVGIFRGYMRLCKLISDLILEIAPGFEYSRALASTVIEASHQQIFFAQHLPNMTDIHFDPLNGNGIAHFLELIVIRTLESEHKE